MKNLLGLRQNHVRIVFINSRPTTAAITAALQRCSYPSDINIITLIIINPSISILFNISSRHHNFGFDQFQVPWKATWMCEVSSVTPGLQYRKNRNDWLWLRILNDDGGGTFFITFWWRWRNSSLQNISDVKSLFAEPPRNSCSWKNSIHCYWQGTRFCSTSFAVALWWTVGRTNGYVKRVVTDRDSSARMVCPSIPVKWNECIKWQPSNEF